jgi:hypothetical protein
MVPAAAVLLAVCVTTAAPCAAQSLSLAASSRADLWSIDDRNFGHMHTRLGFSAALGVGGRAGAVRAAASYAAQGEIEPGWRIIAAEAEPRVALGRAALGVRLTLGAHDMNVTNRHRLIERCRAEHGCLFEAPAFGQGWSTLLGTTATLAVNLAGGTDLTVSYGVSRLVAGANREVTLRPLSLGIEHRFR